MSRRTATRFTSAGLLAAALCSPATAADTPVAPMPRPVRAVSLGLPGLFEIEVEFRTSNPVAAPRPARGIQVEFNLSTEDIETFTIPLTPPTPRRASVAPPCCAFDCLPAQVVVAPMPRVRCDSECREVAFTPMMPPTPPGEVITLPSGRYLERHSPQYFTPDPEFPLQRELATQQNAQRPRGIAGQWNPPKPANVPGAAFDVMADEFGRMLGARQPCPLPTPIRTAGHSVPSGSPMLPPCPLPASAKPTITGTWVREVGPLVYVMKFAPDHVTITVHSALEMEDGKVCTEGILLTADYHLTRDGTTVVGLITGVDALIDGPLPEGADAYGDDLSRVQKVLADKPMAMNVRVYGETLVIGNVRLPEVEGMRGACYPLTMLGGRYTPAGDKEIPKPRAIKVGTPRAYPTSPYAVPAPAYISPPQNPGILPATGGFGSVTPCPAGSGYGYSIPLPPLPQGVPNNLPTPNVLTLTLPTPTAEPPIVQASGTVLLPAPERIPVVEAIPAPREVETPATTPKKKKKKQSGS